MAKKVAVNWKKTSTFTVLVFYVIRSHYSRLFSDGWRNSAALNMFTFTFNSIFFTFDFTLQFMFNMVPKCCAYRCYPAGVAVSSLLPVEDTPPPPPPLLPPSCLLHAAGFRKRKREYWCVFRKVWTSLTFWNQRYRYRQKLTVSRRKYTPIPFYTVWRN